LNNRDRASALRGQCAQLAALEQQMRKSREHAEALVIKCLEAERYPGELADELQKSQRLRDEYRQLENRCRDLHLTKLCAASVDEPF
jgi:hypothetical protein